MSVVITVEFAAKTGLENEFSTYLIETQDETRNFEGCIKFELHTEEESPGTVFMVEEWTAKEAYFAYLAWRKERGDMAKLRQYMGADPITRFFLRC